MLMKHSSAKTNRSSYILLRRSSTTFIHGNLSTKRKGAAHGAGEPLHPATMPAPLNDELSDLDKIRQSLAGITSIASFDDVLAMFGLLDMPRAQKIGIMFGFVTFVLTVAAVLTLLTLGGTWKRIEQQSKAGASATAPDSVTQRKRRALLLERLLEGREWMLRTNYPEKEAEKSTEKTPLTKMLMTVAPQGKEDVPEGYEENYKAAYLRCQDKPGGECDMCIHIKCSPMPCL